MTTHPATTLGNLGAVEAAPGADTLVSALDDIAAFPAVQRLRATAMELPAPENRLGVATHLDLGDSTVDAARCERVLQHLVNPAAAMAELGPDHPTGRTDRRRRHRLGHARHPRSRPPHLTARVVACWADHAANGWSGRQLRCRRRD